MSDNLLTNHFKVSQNRNIMNMTFFRCFEAYLKYSFISFFTYIVKRTTNRRNVIIIVNIAAILLFLIFSESSFLLVRLPRIDLSSLFSDSNFIIPNDLCLINCPG